MGLLSHRVERSELKPGDHIYTWRAAYSYSHHGTCELHVGAAILLSHFAFPGGYGTAERGVLLRHRFCLARSALLVLCLCLHSLRTYVREQILAVNYAGCISSSLAVQ